MTDNDHARLRAAEGWIELGNYSEALRELKTLRKGAQSHYAVLQLRYEIYCAIGQWDWALLVAESAVQLWAARAECWLWRAHAARCATEGGLERARDLLLPAVELFPDDALVPLNLALFECHLGNAAGARRWLALAAARAQKQGAVEKIGSFVTADPALHALWREQRFS